MNSAAGFFLYRVCLPLRGSLVLHRLLQLQRHGENLTVPPDRHGHGVPYVVLPAGLEHIAAAEGLPVICRQHIVALLDFRPAPPRRRGSRTPPDAPELIRQLIRELPDHQAQNRLRLHRAVGQQIVDHTLHLYGGDGEAQSLHRGCAGIHFS